MLKSLVTMHAWVERTASCKQDCEKVNIDYSSKYCWQLLLTYIQSCRGVSQKGPCEPEVEEIQSKIFTLFKLEVVLAWHSPSHMLCLHRMPVRKGK